eukprot:EG_transcript_1042
MQSDILCPKCRQAYLTHDGPQSGRYLRCAGCQQQFFRAICPACGLGDVYNGPRGLVPMRCGCGAQFFESGCPGCGRLTAVAGVRELATVACDGCGAQYCEPTCPGCGLLFKQEGPPAGPTLGCPQCGQRFFQAECPECHAPNYYAGERRPQDAATPATEMTCACGQRFYDAECPRCHGVHRYKQSASASAKRSNKLHVTRCRDCDVVFFETVCPHCLRAQPFTQPETTKSHLTCRFPECQGQFFTTHCLSCTKSLMFKGTRDGSWLKCPCRLVFSEMLCPHCGTVCCISDAGQADFKISCHCCKRTFCQGERQKVPGRTDVDANHLDEPNSPATMEPLLRGPQATPLTPSRPRLPCAEPVRFSDPAAGGGAGGGPSTRAGRDRGTESAAPAEGGRAAAPPSSALAVLAAAMSAQPQAATIAATQPTSAAAAAGATRVTPESDEEWVHLEQGDYHLEPLPAGGTGVAPRDPPPAYVLPAPSGPSATAVPAAKPAPRPKHAGDPAPPPREPRITVTLADQRAATARAEAARERDPPGLGSPPPTPEPLPRPIGQGPLPFVVASPNPLRGAAAAQRPLPTTATTTPPRPETDHITESVSLGESYNSPSSDSLLASLHRAAVPALAQSPSSGPLDASGSSSRTLPVVLHLDQLHAAPTPAPVSRMSPTPYSPAALAMHRPLPVAPIEAVQYPQYQDYEQCVRQVQQPPPPPYQAEQRSRTPSPVPAAPAPEAPQIPDLAALRSSLPPTATGSQELVILLLGCAGAGKSSLGNIFALRDNAFVTGISTSSATSTRAQLGPLSLTVIDTPPAERAGDAAQYRGIVQRLVATNHVTNVLFVSPLHRALSPVEAAALALFADDGAPLLRRTLFAFTHALEAVEDGILPRARAKVQAIGEAIAAHGHTKDSDIADRSRWSWRWFVCDCYPLPAPPPDGPPAEAPPAAPAVPFAVPMFLKVLEVAAGQGGPRREESLGPEPPARSQPKAAAAPSQTGARPADLPNHTAPGAGLTDHERQLRSREYWENRMQGEMNRRQVEGGPPSGRASDILRHDDPPAEAGPGLRRSASSGGGGGGRVRSSSASRSTSFTADAVQDEQSKQAFWQARMEAMENRRKIEQGVFGRSSILS